MAQAPFEVRYSKPFYLSMLVVGLVCCVMAVKLMLDPVQFDAMVRGTRQSPTLIWVVIGGICAVMATYIFRAITRMTAKLPVIVVRPEGIVLTIGQPRMFRWAEIETVALGRKFIRRRLEIRVSPECFAELRLPSFVSDDNFMAAKGKPFTIGITGQGFDRPLTDIVEAVRARRANLIKR